MDSREQRRCPRKTEGAGLDTRMAPPLGTHSALCSWIRTASLRLIPLLALLWGGGEGARLLGARTSSQRPPNVSTRLLVWKGVLQMHSG